MCHKSKHFTQLLTDNVALEYALSSASSMTYVFTAYVSVLASKIDKISPNSLGIRPLKKPNTPFSLYICTTEPNIPLQSNNGLF